MKWWTFHSYNIKLTSHFTGIDEGSETVPKQQFLEHLINSGISLTMFTGVCS